MMTNSPLWSFALVGMLTLGACGSSTHAGGNGIGGAGGSATGGTGGASTGDTGAGGTVCAGGCPASTRGPLSTWEAPRPSFGWTFIAPSGIDGGAVDAGATIDGGASASCQLLPDRK